MGIGKENDTISEDFLIELFTNSNDYSLTQLRYAARKFAHALNDYYATKQLLNIDDDSLLEPIIQALILKNHSKFL